MQFQFIEYQNWVNTKPHLERKTPRPFLLHVIVMLRNPGRRTSWLLLLVVCGVVSAQLPSGSCEVGTVLVS